MTRPRPFLTLPLLFLLAGFLVIIPGLTQEKKPRAVHYPRIFDESRFPIAEYAAADATDPQERAKRHAKGKKYDRSLWRVHPDVTSDSTVLADHGDHNLPALPFDRSSAVVVAQVTDAHAFLSNN